MNPLSLDIRTNIVFKEYGLELSSAYELHKDRYR
jgi:hypothetical protein